MQFRFIFCVIQARPYICQQKLSRPIPAVTMLPSASLAHAASYHRTHRMAASILCSTNALGPADHLLHCITSPPCLYYPSFTMYTLSQDSKHLPTTCGHPIYSVYTMLNGGYHHTLEVSQHMTQYLNLTMSRKKAFHRLNRTDNSPKQLLKPRHLLPSAWQQDHRESRATWQSKFQPRLQSQVACVQTVRFEFHPA